MSNKYKDEWRLACAFRIKYIFTKQVQYGDRDTVFDRTFIEMSIEEAMKDCVRQYSQPDRQYVKILLVERLGNLQGIHKFID